jgi:SAM-dependent methyltransferase
MSLSYELARCVVCGHAEARVIADADDMRAEVEMLWAYHEKRLKPGTPPPRLMDRVAFSEHPPYRLVQCRECGLVYRNPMEREHELTEIYANDAPSLEVLRSLHETQQPALRTQARTLRDVLGRGGSGLEVGSYVGAFLAAARDAGLQFEGLDINADVNCFTRSLGFAVHDGDLVSFDTDREFDAIAIWNTFDQLADPLAVVRKAAKLLRENGVLAVRVPNGACYSRLRPLLARKRGTRAAARAVLAQNNLLTFPYRWGFTPRSLSRLLEDNGFSVTRLRGDVLVPIADEWTRPWARLEETLIKRLLAPVKLLDARFAPWFEVYAVRRSQNDAG